MKKASHILLIVLILSLTLVNTAFASADKPAGGCPPNFELHDIMEHAGDHTHQHIGVSQDLNGDGLICVNHLTETKHLHVDNSIPKGG
jgi:Spy/CpxP family protein refolding chaperone